MMDIPSPAAIGGVQRSGMQCAIRRAIVWYQRLREGRPSPCRFYPTCSSYALEAIDVHGTRRGGWLTLRRLIRCRPLGPSGFDPVPELTDGIDGDRSTAPADTSAPSSASSFTSAHSCSPCPSAVPSGAVVGSSQKGA